MAWYTFQDIASVGSDIIRVDQTHGLIYTNIHTQILVNNCSRKCDKIIARYYGGNWIVTKNK
jgi:hypothetical protein